jgi:hypothetical protein
VQFFLPETPLEDAILECCVKQMEAVVVANADRSLVGVATVRDLNAALEAWYDKVSTLVVGAAAAAPRILVSVMVDIRFCQVKRSKPGSAGATEEARLSLQEQLQQALSYE